jgi:hypothetical protein
VRVDYRTKDPETNADFAFAYCPCSGDLNCEECEGTGHIFLPFICVFERCEEAFIDPQDLMKHESEIHFTNIINRTQ